MYKQRISFIFTVIATVGFWSALAWAEDYRVERLNRPDAPVTEPNGVPHSGAVDKHPAHEPAVPGERHKVEPPPESLQAPSSKHLEQSEDPLSVPRADVEGTNLYPVAHKGQWGYIDKTGKVVITPRFSEADFFHDGLARVKMDDRWGYIDPTGKLVIKSQFRETGNFYDGLAKAKDHGKWGFIDKTGKFIIPPQFTWAGDFKDGVARVRHSTLFSSEWAFINKNGKLVAGRLGKESSPEAYREGGMNVELKKIDEARDFSEGLAAVKFGGLDGRWGYIDPKGTMVIRPAFEIAGDFSRDGLANVKANGKWGYIDKTGRWVIKPQYDKSMPFSDGLALVYTGGMIGGKYGFIDKTGKFVIRPQFEHGDSFSDGLARVKADGRWGFIDKTGKFVIKPRYDDAGNFVNGVASVKTGGMFGGKWHYIDKQGKVLVGPPAETR